jgi:hypothetical protein
MLRRIGSICACSPRSVSMPELVDLVGRHRGGGRGLDRPAVIFLAVRPRPHAGSSVAWARCSVSSAIWRSSAGPPPVTIARARASQLPAMPFSLVRRSSDSTRPPPLRAPGRRLAQLLERLVDQEGGRDQPL